MKLFASLVVVAVAFVAVLYQVFGLRVIRYGSGMPRPVFQSSAEERAAELERHRTAQRELLVPPPLGPSSTASDGSDIQDEVEQAAEGPTAGAEVDAALESAAADGPAATVTGAAEAPTPSLGSWTDFRGPARDGRYLGGGLLSSWPSGGLEPVWHQPVGGGYASFVVADDRAFTIEQRRGQEVVAAYDVASGRELWTHGWDAFFQEYMGGDGPRATPTYANGRVYALGALGELRCLEAATGELVWHKNILADNGAVNLEWGMSASPLVMDGLVIVLPGGPNGRSVVAYDAETGGRVWSVLDDQQAYTSPMVGILAGQRQLLIVSASRVMGLTVDRGELLWEYPWVTFNGISVAQPIVVGDRQLFISAGYGHGAALLEISRDGDQFSARELWTSPRMKNRFNGSVLRDGYVYGLDEGILACVDVSTGELAWKGGRYGYGQVLLAGDQLIVLTEDGDLALVRATPEHHEEVTRFPVLEGKTWNYPAIADGRLLVRNLQEMAAFDLRAR